MRSQLRIRRPQEVATKKNDWAAQFGAEEMRMAEARENKERTLEEGAVGG